MQNEISLDLRLMEFDSSPDQITSAIGIVPTKTWKKGDLINPKGTRQHKENGWLISSGLSKECDFEQHLLSLLSIINPHLDKLKEVCATCYVELSCAIYMYCESEESTPAVHLDRQTTQVLAALGAEIDFDLYVL